jgi:hypothetical protein
MMTATPTHEFVVGERQGMAERNIGIPYGPGTTFPIGDEILRSDGGLILPITREEADSLVLRGAGAIRAVISKVNS